MKECKDFALRAGTSNRQHPFRRARKLCAFPPAVVLISSFIGAAALLCHPAQGAEPGLRVHLPLEDSFADVSGNPVEVTPHNEIRFEQGAAYFSGEETWLELPHISFNNRPFTVTLWVRVTGSHPMYGLVAQKGANRPSHWLHLMLRGARQPYLGFYTNDSISPQPIPVKKWTHLAFVYDGEKQMIWVNGQPICFRKTTPYQGSGGVTYIGRSPRWNNVPSRDFEGYMREFRIYDRALEWRRIAELSGHPDPAEQLTPQGQAHATQAFGAARKGAIPFLKIEGAELTITGEQGQIFEIFGTDGLNNPWQSLGTVTNRWGEVTLVDPHFEETGQRFYKVKFLKALFNLPPAEK